MANTKKERQGFVVSSVLMFALIAGGLLFIVNRALNKGKGIN